MHRSTGIDVLRGALAAYVFLGHLIPWTSYAQGSGATPSILQNAWTFLAKLFQSNAELSPAVIGFIVLSGYCIAQSYNKTPSTGRYFVRRAFRILPLFFLATAFGIAAFTWPVGAPDLISSLSGTSEITASCLAAKLTTLAAFTPQFHPCSYGGNAPLLTVMVEIALYVTFPVFLLVGKRATIVAAVLCVVAGAVISAMKPANEMLFNWWQNSSIYSFFPFWWLGVAIAHRPAAQAISGNVGAIVAAWLALSIAVIFDPTAICSELRKFALAAIFATIILRLSEARIRTNVVSSLGVAGYTLYALHAPVTYSALAAGLPWWMCIVIVVTLSASIYVLIEKPIDRMGHSIAAEIPATLDVPTLEA